VVGAVVAITAEVSQLIGPLLPLIGPVLPLIDPVLPLIGPVLPLIYPVLPLIGPVLPLIGPVSQLIGRAGHTPSASSGYVSCSSCDSLAEFVRRLQALARRPGHTHRRLALVSLPLPL
jgi:hypothetical protein